MWICTAYSIGSKSNAYRKSFVVARYIWKKMNVAKKTISVVSTTKNYHCSQAVIGQLRIVSYCWLANSIMSTIITRKWWIQVFSEMLQKAHFSASISDGRMLQLSRENSGPWVVIRGCRHKKLIYCLHQLDNFCNLYNFGGRRVIGISGSLIWSKTLLRLIFSPCGEFRWSPKGPVSQIHSPHLLIGAPGIFSDLLRSVQTLKREWGAKSNGKLPHLFIPSKTATLVPEFAIEDLPLGRIAALVPEFSVKDLPLDRTLWWWWWWSNQNAFCKSI